MSLASQHTIISPSSALDIRSHFDVDDDGDTDTASQCSIPLGSPTLPAPDRHNSPPLAHRHDSLLDASASRRESNTSTLYTDLTSDADEYSMFHRPDDGEVSPDTSIAPSVIGEERDSYFSPSKNYSPPLNARNADDRASVASCGSGSSRKARPESLLVHLHDSPLILGIALVDFNHLIGPRIEFSKGNIMEDEEVAKILPFLALPDGAHLNAEDYSYFHLVPRGPNPTTIFGISCNQQISASDLLVKGADVTRSIVQKAVVVLASKPIFGPIRAKLGVVTTALFNQRDFTDNTILEDFANSLELSVRGQLTESGLYMGTSIRKLVHTFRQKTLVLVKALMLQKKIMFYGHPVERLCTYQYSLVSLVPGLLQTLDDCGSPPLSERAPKLERATSLRTSDPKSVMAYMGLPLDLFGRDAFFQPYLPLQQLDLLKETGSWLCGCTNSILTAVKEADLVVNIETGTFEFRDPKLERSAGLTAADRKWMDGIIQDVSEGWGEGEDDSQMNLAFRGSDDYLRSKFEEYIYAVLASVRYQEFLAKGHDNGVIITGGSGGDAKSAEDFNPLWISEFKKTAAYDVWERITDPVLFDIIEPRHPCNEKPSVVGDLGIRLQEGIQDLKLEQQLAPARDAVARTFTAGSSGILKAMEGVRGRWTWTQGQGQGSEKVEVQNQASVTEKRMSPVVPSSGLRSFSLLGGRVPPLEETSKSNNDDDSTPLAQAHNSNPGSPLTGFGSPAKWGFGAGIGSFFSTRLPKRDSSSSVATLESLGTGGSAVAAARRESGRGAPASPLVSVVDMPLEEEGEGEDGEETDREADGNDDVLAPFPSLKPPISGIDSAGTGASCDTVFSSGAMTTPIPSATLDGELAESRSISTTSSPVSAEVTEDNGDEDEGDGGADEEYEQSLGKNGEDQEDAYTGMAL